VWAQQGRLLLDAELNEQTAIVLDYLRTLAVDFIGPFGGHIHRAGFKVVREDERFRFTHGHYYVHGLRCEADDTPELDLPDPPFIIYLLVWEQTIGPIQDPTLADPALGPDAANTTRRTKVSWRPHATPRLHGSQRRLSGEESVEEIIEGFARQNAEPGELPLLRAGTAKGGEGSTPDPDTAPVAVPYRGVENQLYRVEIHSGGRADRATFKWSRDNGSVELALESLEGPDAQGELTAKLKRLWIDARSGLETGDWVELVDDGWMPAGEPAPLLQVKTVRLSAREVVLTPGSGLYEFDADRHPFLRRWDQSPASCAEDNAIPITEVPEGSDDWIDLEYGVRVQFLEAGAEYQRGDYWLLPARTATGGVLWPTSHDEPRALRPLGPARYRAPLALVTRYGEPEELRITDLRTLFTHLAWPEAELGDER
jgi:hypothetical protein